MRPTPREARHTARALPGSTPGRNATAARGPQDESFAPFPGLRAGASGGARLEARRAPGAAGKGECAVAPFLLLVSLGSGLEPLSRSPRAREKNRRFIQTKTEGRGARRPRPLSRPGSASKNNEGRIMSSLPRAPVDDDGIAMTRGELLRKIEDQTALVGIVGLGYVGLPLALAVAERGSRVIGFDVDAAKVRSLCAGQSPIRHRDGGRVAKALSSERFSATPDFQRLAEADVIVVCVPTPLTAQREPDMSFVIATARRIRSSLRPGQLVILESTTYPGTTDELVRGILEESGLRCGVDFFLAFSPEREDPGNADHGTVTIPKVVGGLDAGAGDLAQAFYDRVICRTVRVSSSRVAEAVKLTENIFRAVNIALVNELKMVYDRMGIDVWEVLDAASTKPFGFMRFNPGPGWGGHCIPLDPFYLTWKAREYGFATRFIELAGEINVQMPRYV